MCERCKLWLESAGGTSVVWRWVLPLAAGAMLWFHPSNSISEAILWLAGLYAVWNWKKTLAAWRNPVGAFFGLGVLWSLLSVGWSFDPAGTARDLTQAAPMVLAVLAVPTIFDRPGRIWAALVGSAGLVTVRLGVDLIRLFVDLGWPTVMTEARFFHPYLYTHPNVSSMMAGLCVFVFVARGLTGAPGRWQKGLLAAGVLLDLVYLVVLASRGPQAVFAAVALLFPLVLVPGWRPRLVAAVLVAAVGFGLWREADAINPRFRDQTMFNFNNRDTVWSHSKMMADRKPVLGYGFGKRTFVKAIYENPSQRPPLVPVRFPHAHQYWLMLYFQGGAVGFALWSLGWLLLFIRLGRFAQRADRAASGWRERLQVRILPMLLLTGMAFILIYGLGDFPDHAIRLAQFYLAGLGMALTLPPPRGEGASA